MKITEITYEEFIDSEIKKPSNYYIRNALGAYTFFHSRDRGEAQKVCDDMYGKGQYTVNASKMSKAPDSQSAVGRLGSKSRQGMRTKG